MSLTYQVSILSFAHKVGCAYQLDQKNRVDKDIGQCSYTTVGRKQVKIKQVGWLIYHFDVWINGQVYQEAIWGICFMFL